MVEPKPYSECSDLELMSLCCWREARGEGMLGKRGVCHVIANRVRAGHFGGSNIHVVILKPWQFSSFNAADPNSDKWPVEGEASWLDCIDAAKSVLENCDEDFTRGALFYFSPPLTVPPVRQWGNVTETIHVGRITFCKPVPVVSLHAEDL
jgi:spore germination cell wall hydrolase CwlJ-like protein